MAAALSVPARADGGPSAVRPRRCADHVGVAGRDAGVERADRPDRAPLPDRWAPRALARRADPRTGPQQPPRQPSSVPRHARPAHRPPAATRGRAARRVGHEPGFTRDGTRIVARRSGARTSGTSPPERSSRPTGEGSAGRRAATSRSTAAGSPSSPQETAPSPRGTPKARGASGACPRPPAADVSGELHGDRPAQPVRRTVWKTGGWRCAIRAASGLCTSCRRATAHLRSSDGVVPRRPPARDGRDRRDRHDLGRAVAHGRAPAAVREPVWRRRSRRMGR